MKNKYDVSFFIPKFKNLPENYFHSQIMFVYLNKGSKCLKFKDFFLSHGIIHLQTSSHTPKHNGCFERRYRYMVETGLTLLH